MGPDEVYKEAKIGLIKAYQEALEMYEAERGLAETELAFTRERVKVLEQKARLMDLSIALLKVKLKRLGVRNINEEQ